ncbi:MAG: acetoacetate--CoA ligase [candidate division WOR-3 bacterium]
MEKHKVLWEPSKNLIEKSNIKKFINFLNKRYNLNIKDYFDLYDFSIKDIPFFWENFWDFIEIKYKEKFKEVVDDLNKFPGAYWFKGAKLNYAENMLRFRDKKIAIKYIREDGIKKEISYKEIYEIVSKVVSALKKLEIKKGDKIAGFMPNMIETAISMLSSASIGAIWSSCGTEIGTNAIIDRFSQIEPKIIFTVDSYIYKGKIYDNIEKIEEIFKNIPSIEKIIIVPYFDKKKKIPLKNSLYFDEFIEKEEVKEIDFEMVSYEDPLFIMFSSGTTGKPKCIVQSQIGVLINHLKELYLHTDLKENDVITYITTPSWMMWNWLLSSLFFHPKIILYDGNPFYPDIGRMFKIIEEEKISIFGLSASYINYLKSNNFKPREKYNLKSLREISQTGSPLSEEGFEYVYENIKDDLWLNSISGGTEINGCFVAGSPTLKVHSGEIQAKALAMKVKIYDEEGNEIIDKIGELVCEAPSPSMPLYFYNDPDFKKYRETYFEFYKNKNVWRHGDYAIFYSKTKGLKFFGRSDATLKIKGVRIGTSEIYNVLENIEEIEDSLATSKRYGDEEEIILFVKMKKGIKLTEEIEEKIRKNLRERASPRHVPYKIIEVPDIPYTPNMKKVEIAVKKIIEGEKVINKENLINPDSLTYFEKIKDKI